MQPLPTQQIWEIAYFDPYIRASVALELGASWPIPMHDDKGRLGYQFFYYAAFGPPSAPEKMLWPPSWLARIDAETGEVVRLEERGPVDFDIHGPRDRPFATHGWPAEWSPADAEERRKALLAAYDTIVPLWDAAQRAGHALPGTGTAEFRARFLALTEPPLLPCYQILGAGFFAWIGLESVAE